MIHQLKTKIPTASDLWFLPLGGSGEIGMNLNLYGHDHEWLMVDLGITFGDRFGIDIITPDPEFIVHNRDRLVGLIITHAHEDHVGAVPYLWPLLRCPIYATKFTAEILRDKIHEFPWANEVEIIEVPLSGSVQIGKFSIEFITLTHSIPEPNALAITTPLGTVMHTGDWKIDPDPLVGGATDAQKLTSWGDKGILAMVCDSTNVFAEGVSGSEDAVRQELNILIGEHPTKRVVVACFASNVARLETAFLAAQKYNRRVCLLGRSMDRMVKAAQKSGYLKDIPTFIDTATAMNLPPHEVMIVSTGSQGEPRSALSRLSTDSHPRVKLDHRDVVFFSSRVIPGNESSISALQNNLVRKGIEIITSHEEDIHVSGHPARDELRQMYKWVRPHVLIPVHGELRHMMEQASLGLECGIPKAVVPENGTLIQVEADNPRIIDEVPVGQLGLDGTRLVPMINPMIRDRARLAVQGSIFISIAVDKNAILSKTPQITLLGVCSGKEESDRLDREIHKTIRQIINNGFQTLESLKEEIRNSARRVVNQWIGKKPVTEIHIIQE
jgi:ribonuclease J